ncbi:hypothetical protein KJ605_01040, partial [Patescibacteria group bacterium]|nr:hypothetical protein [Patescibacteria group bacterium]
MKVYFTSSSKGSHANLDEIRGIINILKSLNVDLVIAWDKLKAIEGDAYKEKKANPEKIFKGNIAAITQSDLAIFETSVPSWGLGYQVAVATTNGIPTLCLYTKEGENSAISNLIGGVRSPLLQYKAYSNQQE